MMIYRYLSILLPLIILGGCSWLSAQQQYISQVEFNYHDGELAKISVWCESGEKSDSKTADNPL